MLALHQKHVYLHGSRICWNSEILCLMGSVSKASLVSVGSCVAFEPCFLDPQAVQGHDVSCCRFHPLFAKQSERRISGDMERALHRPFVQIKVKCKVLLEQREEVNLLQNRAWILKKVKTRPVELNIFHASKLPKPLVMPSVCFAHTSLLKRFCFHCVSESKRNNHRQTFSQKIMTLMTCLLRFWRKRVPRLLLLKWYIILVNFDVCFLVPPFHALLVR